MIYDFSATPILSGVTLITHAVLLFLFWRATAPEHLRWSPSIRPPPDAPFRGSGSRHDRQSRSTIADDHGTVEWRRHQEARRELDALLAQYPTFAQGYLQRAVMVGGRQQLNKDAFEAAGKALELGLTNMSRRVLAHQIRSLYQLQRGDGAAAQKELDAVLMPTAFNDPDEIIPIQRAELHQLRAQAFRRQGQYEAAYAEIELALKLAREMGLEPAIQRYAEEKEIIEKHARRSFTDSPTIMDGKS